MAWIMLDKDCKNYGSSWCIDFGDNCIECSVQQKKIRLPNPKNWLAVYPIGNWKSQDTTK